MDTSCFFFNIFFLIAQNPLAMLLKWQTTANAAFLHFRVAADLICCCSFSSNALESPTKRSNYWAHFAHHRQTQMNVKQTKWIRQQLTSCDATSQPFTAVHFLLDSLTLHSISAEMLQRCCDKYIVCCIYMFLCMYVNSCTYMNFRSWNFAKQ